MCCAVALPSFTFPSLFSSRPIDPAQGPAAPPSYIAADADDAPTDRGRTGRWRRNTRPPSDGLAPPARAPHPSGSSVAGDDRPIVCQKCGATFSRKDIYSRHNCPGRI